MKKIYLTMVVVFMAAVSNQAMAQSIGLVLGESFDDGTLPADWTRVQTAGSDGWTFGVSSVVAAPPATYWNVPASPDASPFTISNDDLCNCTADNDQLNSPVMDWSEYDSVYVYFDWFYDQAYNLSEAYFTLSYDAGASWLYLPLTPNATTWVDDQLVIIDPVITIDNVTYTINDQMMIGFLHIDGDGWASGFAVDDVLIGGWSDPCGEVINIPSCNAPQTVSAEGFGTVDWQFITGCGYTTFGEEQLYTFTPSVTGVHTLDVTAATGNSWIDYMYKPVSAGCDTLGWTCLGDANTTVSYGMNLTAGVQYYILADNEFIDLETQTFSISCPCTFTSQGYAPESEACGADLNGGCNSTPAAYESISCGSSISGTLWADGGNRDTDWFELVVTENTDIEVDFSGGLPINAILIDNCTDLTVLDEATSAACGSGSITYAVTPGTYLLVLVPTAFESYPCGTGSSNQYDLTVTYCENNPSVDPCLTSADTWTDLNGAGGAPCNDGGGCTPTDPNFTTFGIYGSETYLLANVQAGFDYVFDMCTGVGAGSWIPEIAIVAPDGTTIDAWNGEAATGSSLTFLDQCSLGWTASQSGTYSIIINQLGTAAGDAPNQVDCNTSYAVDNGNPTVLCGPNAASCLPCEAGTLTSPAVQSICPGETFDVALSGNSTPGTYNLFFDNTGTGGTGGTEAPVTITGYTQGDFPLAIDEDINGVLSFNSLPPLAGTWLVKVIVVDNIEEDCDSTGTFTVNFLGANDPQCITVGVEDAEVVDLNVYPNPSNGLFTVEMNDVEGKVTLNVVDVTGRTILTETHQPNGGLFREQLQLDSSSGTYLLQVITTKGVETRRLQVR